MVKVVLLLPAYNEEGAIGPLLERVETALRGLSYAVLVVDDGSSDATAAEAERHRERMPLTVLRRPRNGGLGSALVSGITHLLAQPEPVETLVTMDADNTHDPALIHEMLRRLAGGADVVIGSRFQSGAEAVGVPLYRRALSGGARLVFGLVIGARGVRDYTSGYRAYRFALIQRLSRRFRPLVRARGFAVMTELLAKSAADGAVCAEVPMVLRYDLKESASKLRLVPTLVEYVRVILLARLDSLRSQRSAESSPVA